MSPRPAHLLAAALLLGAPFAASGEAVPIDGRPSLELGSRLEALVDEGGRLDAPAALQAFRAGRSDPVGRPSRSLGSGVRVVWLHALLRGGPPGAWVLTWDQPLVDRLDGWILEPDREAHLQGGLAVPVAERTIRHAGPYHALPLRLAAGQEADLLLRVESSRPVVVDVTLWSEVGLEARAMRQGQVGGLELGALLVVILLCLVAALVRRDGWSGRLAATLLAYLLYELNGAGLGARWLWPDTPRWSVAASPFLAAVTGLLGIAYARAYVDSRRHHPALDRLARGAAWLAGGCAALALLLPFAGRGDLAIFLGALPTATAFATLVVLAGASVRRGDGSARWFLAACLLVALVGVAFTGAITGLLPASPLVLGALRPALLVGSLLLYVGGLVRSEGERRAASAGLSQAVEARTASLRDTVDRLQVEVLERERAERQLREADERFRVAFDTSPDSINLNRLDDGVFLAINQGFTRITGWTEAEVLGRSSLEVQIWVDPADRARLVAGLRASGTVQNLEARFRFKGGRIIEGLMSAQVVPLAGVPHILSITRDITEMRLAERERDALAEQLRQAQKLEAIGRLAGGVAHDFNNLLTAITTNASLALLDLPPGDPTRPSFEEIQDAAGRATSLTRQLLAFSRRQVIAPRSIDLDRQVAGLAGVLRRLLGEDVAVAFVDGGAPPVLADPGQIEQVVLNLAVNARDAVRAGGHITITTRSLEVATAEATPERLAGRFGAIEVADDGPGVDPEVLPHIFEPFFTTKQGHGTGLGLSTVYGIASQHGGFVEVESAPGRGARFLVCFPVAAEPPAEVVAGQGAPEPLARGSEQVLLAEDEPAVREATRTLLTRLGYRVLVARDGVDALALAGGHAGRIDLLLTDVVMPGLNGRQLAERLLASRPGLAVVFMSGYTQDVVDQAGVLEEGLILVQKPYQPGALAAALRRALAVAARAPVL